MNDREQSPMVDSRRYASSVPADDGHSEREMWTHEFRNALGNIIVAAGAAKSLITDLGEIQASIAMGHIEQGCNRCLRLLRTMPPF